MLTDLRHAVRQLLKNPGFTVIALLTLALGIGVNTTMFSILNALVLQESPAPDSGRLVSVFRTSPQSQDWPHSPANFYDYRRQNKSFERLAAFSWNNYNLAEAGQPAERLAGMAVTGDFFQLMGIPQALGRPIGPDDDRAGAGQVAVLSDGFWRTHFAADPGVIGRTVRMDGASVVIVGVMPPSFDNPTYWGHVDLWRPLAFDGGTLEIRDNNWLQACLLYTSSGRNESFPHRTSQPNITTGT